MSDLPSPHLLAESPLLLAPSTSRDDIARSADEGAQLSPKERRIVEELVQTAARKLPVRFVAVDVGQLKNGEWTVIETGDPQFSGLSQIAPLAYWNRLRLTLSTSGS